MGVAQECIHSIKLKNLNSIILKLDLEKAYDQINWDYLRLILLQTSLPLEIVNWIMCCVTSACFFVLLNGSLTYFFHGNQGIWQGFPLSPYLFLLAIEGLSLLIKKAVKDKLVKGINISNSLMIAHVLFVDDVLLLGKGLVDNWQGYASIITTFCAASGMVVS